MVREQRTDFDHEFRPRPRGRSRGVLAFIFVAVAVTACSSTPTRDDHPAAADETAAAEEAPMSPEAREFVYREPRPVSDTHPYQINDYLIYPVKWNKVEDVAPTVQELFQARYGPGVVVIPHVATNKLLIYLPPPHERERAGAAGTQSGLRTPSTRGTATRGATTTRGRASRTARGTLSR